MRVMESEREKKGPLDGRTLGLTGTWAQVEDNKKVQPDGRRHARLVRGTHLGRPAWEGSVDQRWRPAGRSAIQVDSCPATGQDRAGEEAGAKRERIGVDG